MEHWSNAKVAIRRTKEETEPNRMQLKTKMTTEVIVGRRATAIVMSSREGEKLTKLAVKLQYTSLWYYSFTHTSSNGLRKGSGKWPLLLDETEKERLCHMAL